MPHAYNAHCIWTAVKQHFGAFKKEGAVLGNLMLGRHPCRTAVEGLYTSNEVTQMS